MQSEPSSGIKLTAYSCICWLFHRIYYDARNHKHKTSHGVCTVHLFVMGNGDVGDKKVITTGARNKKLIYTFFIGNSMQKVNRGDREIDVRIILKCMSEKGRVL